LLILIFIAIESFVVWNTVLVTTVGVVAAGFALGAALPMLIGLSDRPWGKRLAPAVQ
jgi:hypothetical protein